MLESIKTIYGIKHKNGAIRRVNVNIAASTVENYRRLKEAGIGTYILFQEDVYKRQVIRFYSLCSYCPGKTKAKTIKNFSVFCAHAFLPADIHWNSPTCTDRRIFMPIIYLSPSTQE